MRLADLCSAGGADAAALARALVRCGMAFAPDVYAALAVELGARLRVCCGGGSDGSGRGSDFSGLAGAWRDALTTALTECFTMRLSGAGGNGVDELAARMACAAPQPPPEASAAAPDAAPDAADVPPVPSEHAGAARADAAAAVLAALVAAAGSSAVSAASSAAPLAPVSHAAALCRLLCRLGPRLAAGSAARDAVPALDALLAPFAAPPSPCAAGAAACIAARSSRDPAAAAAPPPLPCAACAALALRAASWAAPDATPCIPYVHDIVNDCGNALTQDVLLRDGDSCGLQELRAAVAALPWRQASRDVSVCGRPLRLAQRPRDVRPRKGGAGETGLVLWGAALLMTWHMEHDAPLRALLARGARVLELGCGAGLCAAAAALLGGDVTATDGDDEVVALAAENAAAALADAAAADAAGAADAMRRGTVVPQRLRWGDAADTAALAPPYALVLAADVVYFTVRLRSMPLPLPARVLTPLVRPARRRRAGGQRCAAGDAGACGGCLARLPGCGAPPLHALRCSLLLASSRVSDARPRPAVLMAHTWRKPDAEGAFFARMAAADSGAFRCEDVTPLPDAPGAPPRPHGTRLLRFWRDPAECP